MGDRVGTTPEFGGVAGLGSGLAVSVEVDLRWLFGSVLVFHILLGERPGQAIVACVPHPARRTARASKVAKRCMQRFGHGHSKKARRPPLTWIITCPSPNTHGRRSRLSRLAGSVRIRAYLVKPLFWGIVINIVNLHRIASRHLQVQLKNPIDNLWAGLKGETDMG